MVSRSVRASPSLSVHGPGPQAADTPRLLIHFVTVSLFLLMHNASVWEEGNTKRTFFNDAVWKCPRYIYAALHGGSFPGPTSPWCVCMWVVVRKTRCSSLWMRKWPGMDWWPVQGLFLPLSQQPLGERQKTLTRSPLLSTELGWVNALVSLTTVDLLLNYHAV